MQNTDDAAAVVTDDGPSAAASKVVTGSTQDLVIYHASSSHSHPLTLPEYFSAIRNYFQHNPARLRLPLARWFTIDPDYKPRPWQLTMYKKLVGTQIKLIRTALTAAGDCRAAAALKNGFESWKSPNSTRYDRSLCCCVDNARALQQQLPAEEAQLFRMVWEPQDMSWELYCNTFMAGMGRLLLRQETAPKGVEHKFRYIPDI